MENGSNRSLAYQLASSIGDAELNNISGGMNGQLTSVNRSIRLSGSSLCNVDTSYDVTFDM